jgi:aryl-alcohol dehydrogenase-like predicted oxidoreductase
MGYMYTAEWRVDAKRHEVKDLSLTTLRRQLAESRALLRPHLRFYQIHSATIERAIEIGIFDTVQATWNLLERSAGPILAEAHEAGLGVMVKEALANGRLTARGDVPSLLKISERRGSHRTRLRLKRCLRSTGRTSCSAERQPSKPCVPI